MFVGLNMIRMFISDKEKYIPASIMSYNRIIYSIK